MVRSSLTLEPLDGAFGAIVRDLSLRELDDRMFELLHEAWLEHALLIFPDQFLTTEEQNTFARCFGDLEFPAAPISNIARDGTVISDPASDVVRSLRGNEGWHHDSTYMPVQAKGAVFSAEITPSSGAATGFADMRAAYDALGEADRARVAGLTAKHSLYYSMGRADLLPTQNAQGGYDLYGYHDKEVSVRPLVKTHPETGRPNLVIGRHAHDVSGMDPAASEEFLDELNEWACHPQRVYFHQWESGDTVLWDNRRLMHRGTPFDMTEPRRMWHTRIAGDPTSESADNHLPAATD